MPRTPYQQLGDAQEAAAKAGTPAPCTEAPDRWIKDQFFRYELLDLIHACQVCPVLDLCQRYKDDSHRNGKPLTGVVAGELLSMGEAVAQKQKPERPPRNAFDGFRVGSVSLAQAVEWSRNGVSQTEIGRLAGVTPRAVNNAFKRLADRAQGCAA